MIRACFCFDDFHFLFIAQLSQYFSNIFFDLSVDFFSTVFRDKNDVVFTSVT